MEYLTYLVDQQPDENFRHFESVDQNEVEVDQGHP
jgi:hypothetical protein